MPEDTVLVYGATGTQGGPVAQRLIDMGRHVRVVSRSAERAAPWAEKGAEVAVADLGDPQSLAAANAGVDRVVLQLPLQYDFTLHETYGRNAVDAARAAGVKLVVMNTSAHVFPASGVHAYEARQEVIEHLRSSGVPSIILRPTFYMEILLGPWIKPNIVDKGVLAFPLPADFPMSWVSAGSMADFLVAALDRDDLAGSSYEVAESQARSGAEIAGLFSQVLGRPVSYLPITPDDYEQSLAPMFGPTVAHEVAAQVRYMIDRGSGAVDMAPTATALAVAPTPWERWIPAQRWQRD